MTAFCPIYTATFPLKTFFTQFSPTPKLPTFCRLKSSHLATYPKYCNLKLPTFYKNELEYLILEIPESE